MTKQHPESDITGSGYGAAHHWKNRGTHLRSTLYQCSACNVKFWHHYPHEPNIFRAMDVSGVPNECPALAVKKEGT